MYLSPIPPRSALGTLMSSIVVDLYMKPDDEQREIILSEILVNGGDIKKTAWTLGVARSKLYVHIADLGLWPAINEIRKRFKKQSDLDKHSHRFIQI